LASDLARGDQLENGVLAFALVGSHEAGARDGGSVPRRARDRKRTH
jgi:hypothetical protein